MQPLAVRPFSVRAPSTGWVADEVGGWICNLRSRCRCFRFRGCEPRRCSRKRASTRLANILEFVMRGCGIPAAEWRGLAAVARDRASQAMTLAGEAGMMPIPLLDDRYPALLSVTVDPPPVLWVQGQAELLSRPTVAVVGSRAATPYALEVAARLGEELAQRGIVVASGLARGVDSAAHRGCLAASGSTTAVLGSGLDRVYPAEHRELAVTISKTWCFSQRVRPRRGGPSGALSAP